VIVKYKSALNTSMGATIMSAPSAQGQNAQRAARMGRRLGLTLQDGRVIGKQMQVLQGEAGMSSTQLAARLSQDSEVAYAVPDRRQRILAVAPNDPLYDASPSISPAVGQWYLRAPDATIVSAINAVGAWAYTTGVASVIVADVDTGVRFDHPDLAGKLLAGYDFISDSTVANDGDGRDADATDPGDWTTDGECGSGETGEPSSWHGTQTASLIAAQTNNGVGMASVGYDTKVLPVRALGKCGGYDSDIIAGMLWAAGISNVPTTNANPARVINLSLGGTGSCSAAYADAIGQLTAAGVVVVAAAGNSSGLAVTEPANCAGVIAVTGLRHSGTKVGYANLGPEVSIAAPGGNCVTASGECVYPIITATNTGSTTAVGSSYTDGTNAALGTSFSTPMVSATVALMLAANPSLTPAEVKSLLQSSARAFPTTSSDSNVGVCQPPSSTQQLECICTASTCGAGMLDTGAAVAAAVASAKPSASVSASATTVVAGTTVSLDGSASTAPSGRTIASYAWSITSGGAFAAFTGATNGSTASLLTSAAGTVVVALTVTDSEGQQATKSVNIIVNAVGSPTVQISASGNPVAAGDPVTFNGASSTAAAGRTVASYAWSIASGGALASFTTGTTGATAAVSTVGSSSGSFTVMLTVTDDLGVAASDTYTVNVTAVVPTPVITPSATSVTTGQTLTFDGSASSATTGRTLASYQWSLVAGSSIASISGSTTGSSLSLTTSGAGQVKVQLTVTDSAGASASVVSTVNVVAASSTTGSSGGGGGALDGVGLLLLGALWARSRKP
jgi:serine protease